MGSGKEVILTIISYSAIKIKKKLKRSIFIKNF